MDLKAITLVGKNGSGKSEAGKFIAQHFNLTYLSTSSLIEQKLGVGRPREDLVAEGRRIIESYDNGFAGFVIDNINIEERYVIDRMIDTLDIEYLKSQGSFILVTALDFTQRFERIRQNNRVKDSFTGNYREDLKRMQEMDSKDNTDLNKAFKLSDYILDTGIKRVPQDLVLMRKLTEYLQRN